jgi:hypothetical protein
MNHFMKKSYTESNDLYYSNRELLESIGINYDLLQVANYSLNDSECDVYHFYIQDSHKLRHIGIYNNKIEFDYVL